MVGNTHIFPISSLPISRQTILVVLLGLSTCGLVTVASTGLRLTGSSGGSGVGVSLRYLAYDDDVDAPYVENMSPASGATLANVTGSIVLRIKDYKSNAGIEVGSGVSMRSVQITVYDGATSTLYNSGSTTLSASGASFNRRITIVPEDLFPYSTRIHVTVDAEDLHDPANVMSTFRYSFLTEDEPEESSSSSGGGGGSADPGTGAGPGGGSHPHGAAPGTHLIPDSAPGTVHPSPGTPPRSHSFEDVPARIWYEDSLIELVARHVIDGKPRLFRPADGTTRAELAKMLVVMKQITPGTVIASSFADVRAGTWYAPFVQEASVRGWMRGYGNCVGAASCLTRPSQVVTRAEAALMIARAFSLSPLSLAPDFADVRRGEWYAAGIETAADRCVIRGDDETGLARPASSVTRAEIVAMLSRAEKQLRYGKDCAR